jgi:parallel beta-helix repeat protein
VGHTADDNFSSIQEGINAAEPGDIVSVRTGVYYENVVVNKSVSIFGEDRETTVVDSGGAGYVVFIEADNVTVSGFTLRNSGIGSPNPFCGVKLNASSNCLINDNKIVDNDYGVWFDYSDNNTFVGNVVAHNSGTYGIRLYESRNNNVSGNEVANNGYGIYVYGGSSGTIVTHNKVSGNGYGIFLKLSDDNLVEENTVSGSGFYGITVWFSGGNVIFHNNFVDNSIQFDVSDAFGNVWDDGYPSGGNYWSDYAVVDVYSGVFQNESGSDGIGDEALVLKSPDNVDRYPLMSLYGVPKYELVIGVVGDGTTEPSPGAYNYTAGTVVSVSAVPNLGFSLDYWLLDDMERSENPLEVVMDGGHVLKAFFVDDVAPEVGAPSREPSGDVAPYENVTVTVGVVDSGSGVRNVTLWYSVDGGLSWSVLNMSEVSGGGFLATIPGYGNGTWVAYKIVAYDYAGNVAVSDEGGSFFKYRVVPEFSGFAVLLVVALFSVVFVFVRRRFRLGLSLV